MYQAEDWVSDWRDFADKMGYTYDKILAIAEKARPAMKLITYLSHYHPYTTLKEMENLCRNQMETNELAQTIREIREANARYNEPYEKTQNTTARLIHGRIFNENIKKLYIEIVEINMIKK